MTRDDFVARTLALEATLYRISYSIVGNPHDQADAVQETIARALQRLHTLRKEEYFGTWMVRILINVCNDLLKKRGREMPMESIEVSLPDRSDTGMAEALAKLEPKYRLTIVLHHIEGYTTREIAQMMRTPEGTVKFRLTRGRALLQELLREGGIGREITR